MARYTESFDKADSTTLGPDLSWTETNGNLQIVTNRVGIVTTGTSNRARAESDMASDDNYAQITIVDADTSATNRWGVCCRYDSAADTCYIGSQGDGTSANNTVIFKVVAGVGPSSIATGTHTKATNDVLRIEANGSQITFYINGVANITVTDTAITSGKRGGIALRANSTGLVFMDNFVTGDLAIAAGQGNIASGNNSDMLAGLDLQGHGDAASGNPSELLAALDLAGHGDVASANISEALLSADLAGHGDSASTGTGSLDLAADLTAHGDNASTGVGDLIFTADLSGHGDIASASTSQGLLGADLAGHGDQATTGTAELLITADLSGHGDISDSSTGAIDTTRCAHVDSDGVASSWTTTPLFDKIDEIVADDSDEITSETRVAPGNTTIANMNISDFVDPGVDTGHVFRVRSKATFTLGSAAKLRMSILLNNNIFAQVDFNLTTSYQTFEYAMPTATAALITDYSNLQVEFTGVFAAGNLGSVQVSWFEFCLGIESVILAGHGDNASTGSAELLLTLDLTGHGDNVATGLAALLLAAYMEGMGAAADGSTGDLTVTSPGGGGAVAVLNRYQLGKRRAVANRSRGIRS